MGMESRFANEGTATQSEIYSSKNRVTMKVVCPENWRDCFPSYTHLVRSFLGVTLVSSDKELV